jgi:LmbE family N-acetylglucosaminyl deacetylase
VIESLGTVLVLAPHTDDGEFGCGGTMARLRERGVDVRQVAFSTASRSLPPGFPPDALAREVRAASAEIGLAPDALTVHDFEVRTFPAARQEILELLIEAWRDLRPGVVLLPSLRDIHQDHGVVAAEGLRAFKRTTVLAYEIPWNTFEFRKQAYVSLEQRHVDAKVRALACYRSQQHRNYANEEYVRNLARTRGIEVGREHAECFEVVRWVA